MGYEQDSVAIYLFNDEKGIDVYKRQDKDYFPPALCGTIIRSDTVAEHPELGTVLKKLNGAISNQEMRSMNAAVDIDGEDPQKVAREFLQRKGLI